MKKIIKHELFDSHPLYYTPLPSLGEWYTQGKNRYDDGIPQVFGENSQHRCIPNDVGFSHAANVVLSKATIFNTTPHNTVGFSISTAGGIGGYPNGGNLPRTFNLLTKIEFADAVACNTLPFEVELEVYLYHFKMYSIFHSTGTNRIQTAHKHEEYKKRLWSVVKVNPNDIVSLGLGGLKFDNLDTDAFYIEVCPRRIINVDTRPQRDYPSGRAVDKDKHSIFITSSYKSTYRMHTLKTFRNDHGWEENDITEYSPDGNIENIDNNTDSKVNGILGTSNEINSDSIRPEQIDVTFNPEEIIIKEKNSENLSSSLLNVHRMIFDTESGFSSQHFIADPKLDIVAGDTNFNTDNSTGKLIRRNFFSKNENGIEEKINEIVVHRDIKFFQLEGEQTNYISIWRFKGNYGIFYIMEDTRIDSVEDAKITPKLIKSYKSEDGDLKPDTRECEITFKTMHIFIHQLYRSFINNYSDLLRKRERAELATGFPEDLHDGHFEYETVITQLDRLGNSLGDVSINFNSKDYKARIVEPKELKTSKTVTLNPLTENIVVKSSQAKLENGNFKPTQIASKQDIFKIDGKETASELITDVSDFTVTIIDGDTSGKKTFRLSWTDHDEPSDDILYSVGIKGSSIVATETSGTIKTINSNANFGVDKNATSFDIPEDRIFFDSTLLTSDILDESRFEFTFRKMIKSPEKSVRSITTTTNRSRRPPKMIWTVASMSIVIYEGSEYQDGLLVDNFITSSSDIYYQTEGLYYGVSYSPNLFYLSKNKGDHPYSFSGHGIENINLCDYYIVIKGRPQSDLRVLLYNSGGLLGAFTDLHTSGLYWDGESLEGFSVHGVKKEIRWTVIRVPILRKRYVEKIVINSSIGGYNITIDPVTISRHPDYSYGYDTNIINNRGHITVYTNWQNNTGKLSDYERSSIGYLSNTLRRNNEVITFADVSKEQKIDELCKPFVKYSSFHSDDFLNKKLIQTPLTLDWQGDIIFDDDRPDLLRPTVKIYCRMTDGASITDLDDTSDWAFHPETLTAPFTTDTTTNMFYKKSEIPLSSIVKARTSIVESNERTLQEAQEAIGDAKVVVELFFPKTPTNSFDIDDAKFSCKTRVSIIGIDIKTLYYTTPATITSRRKFAILQSTLQDLFISVASSETSPEYEFDYPESVLNLTALTILNNQLIIPKHYIE